MTHGKIKKFEFRITLPGHYAPSCPGHTDLSARNGYYVDGDSEGEAISTFRTNHPEYRFASVDIQLWKTWNKS